MCELLGMSANVPTDICFSFAGLMRRGGATGPHRDGWGIVFYQGKGMRGFRDPDPSARSEIAQLVRRFPIKSDIVVAHIRQANSGRVCLENTHPFNRELWGRYWSFAHNGQLRGMKRRLRLGRFRPVGTTDSEHACCWMLARIEERFPAPPRRQAELAQFVHGLCEELRGFGVFNMLLSDSRVLYGYCATKMVWLTRRAPFGEAQLSDDDVTVNFSQETTPRDIVTVVATAPLTRNERWQQMQPGELRVFRRGRVSLGGTAGAGE